MKVVVIDGQGGGMGKQLVEAMKNTCPEQKILCVGTNALATSAMLRAGADAGATGENAVIVNARDADLILGPLGIVLADALLGETTAAMAVAVGSSPAEKILIPSMHCRVHIAGLDEDKSMRTYIDSAIQQARRFLESHMA